MNEANATLPAKLSVLPDSWIERIFTLMSAMYGALFRERWRDCDLDEVKRVWAEELSSFSDNPECFGLALKAMVGECKFPPTLPEFVAICRKHYSRPKLVALEHKLSPEEIERNREKINRIVANLEKGVAT